jgi:hypothetical protein
VRRRSIVHEQEFTALLKKYLPDDLEADEAIRLWGETLAMRPERGYAVRGAPEYSGIPLHLKGNRAFLIVYWYDNDKVYCMWMEPIPFSSEDFNERNDDED